MEQKQSQKEIFQAQIEEIAGFPDRVLEGRDDDITGLNQQKERIKNLAARLQERLNQLNFELFEEIMGEEEYDTQIYYYGYYDTEDLAKRKRHETPILKLKQFFESSEYTNERKKAIEEIIIFGFFLRATYDFYKWLALYYDEGSYQPRTPEHPPDTSATFLEYFELLDNLSYKCNPIVYKLLSSLNYIALCLALSSLIIIPLAVPLMVCPPLLAGILITSLILVFFVPPALTSVCSICGSAADQRWGINWAYPLPINATEYLPKEWGMHPYEIGIFPSLFGRPAISAGSSFKAMNRLGFFPFKETANEAIEIAESVLETNTGKTAVNLPSRFRPGE